MPLHATRYSDSRIPDSGTFIPSESSIKVARERRERLRTTGVSAEDDFISLSVVKRADESQGPHPESRLMREEDELGEGDDGALLFCLFMIHSNEF
jgi:GC-rich sequence DNA-binding factor